MNSVFRLIERPVDPVSAKPSGSLPSFPPALTYGLTPQDMALVNAARPNSLTLEPGESLYFQGDPCRNTYLLQEGWAFQHQILEDGRRQILDFALPGVVSGLPGSQVLSHSLEALTPCLFSVLAHDRLHELMRAVPIFGLRLLEAMADAQARAFEHLTSVGRRTASERVAHLLQELSTRLQDQSPSRHRQAWALPLMLPHIADALGLTSETVCRVLSAMRKQRILSLRGQWLEVIDERRLSVMAGIHLDVQISARPRPISTRISKPSIHLVQTTH